MPVVNGYCTDTQLRTQLQDDGSNLSPDLLERAINAASRAIDKHCGRRFWQDSAVATRTFIVYRGEYAFVDDISTRTGLIVKTGTDGVAFPDELTVDVDFALEPRNADKFATSDLDAYAFWQIRPVNGRRLPANGLTPTLSVTARFGWSSVPFEVQEACILKAAALFKRKDAPFGVAGFGDFGAVRITRADADVLDLLAPYKVPGFS